MKQEQVEVLVGDCVQCPYCTQVVDEEYKCRHFAGHIELDSDRVIFRRILPESWAEVRQLVGDEPASTLFFLFVEALAEEAGLDVNSITDPQIPLSELADEDGEVDADVLNRAERTAISNYEAQYAWRLGHLTNDVWEDYMALRWSEGMV